MKEEEKNKSEITFEEGMQKLEGIVKTLEAGTCPLEDAINLFTEGMNLAKSCGDKLTAATEKVNKVLSESGTLEDFDTPVE